MVTIDGKRLILATAFLVANDKEVEVVLPLEAGAFKMYLKFTKGAEGEQHSANFEGDNTQVRFNLKGWGNPLGTATNEPAQIGNLQVEGKPVFLQLVNHGIGELNHVHIYLMV